MASLNNKLLNEKYQFGRDVLLDLIMESTADGGGAPRHDLGAKCFGAAQARPILQSLRWNKTDFPLKAFCFLSSVDGHNLQFSFAKVVEQIMWNIKSYCKIISAFRKSVLSQVHLLQSLSLQNVTLLNFLHIFATTIKEGV